MRPKRAGAAQQRNRGAGFPACVRPRFPILAPPGPPGTNRRPSPRLPAALLLALLLLAVALPAPAAPPANPFAGDERFDHRITLALRDRSLDEFLALLNRKHGLPLTADPSTVDEQLTVFCRDRPAGEVLAAVARHLDYTWVRKRTDGEARYLLLQTAEQRQREADALAALRAEDLSRLRKRVEEHLEQAKWTPTQWREHLLRELGKEEQPDPKFGPTTEQPRERRQALQALEPAAFPPEGPVPGSSWLARTWPPLHDPWFQTGSSPGVGWLSSHWAAQATALLSVPDARERLERGERVRCAWPPRPGWAPLSVASADVMVRGLARLAPGVDEEEGVPQELIGDLYQAAAELWVEQAEPMPSLRFRCRYVARRVSPRFMETVYEQFPYDRGYQNLPVSTYLDLNDAVLQRRIRIPVPADGFENIGSEGVALGEYLETLAPAITETLIADGYDSEYNPPPPRPGPQTLAQYVRAWCPAADVVVRREGGILTFRHRDWARQRTAELPRRQLQELADRVRQPNVLSLRELAALTASLTDAQLETLDLRWSRRPPTIKARTNVLLGNLYKKGAQLRLLATLSPAQLERLMQAASPTLPLARPDQKAILRRRLAWPPRVEENMLPGSFEIEKPGGPSLLTRFDAHLAAEDAPDTGLPRYALKLTGTPGPFFCTNDRLSLERSREAFRARNPWLPPTVRDEEIHALDGGHWVVAVVPLRPNLPEIDPVGFTTSDRVRGSAP